MLIDIGRVTGNLKHRTITMVSMRNVFKLMGARVVKGEVMYSRLAFHLRCGIL